MPYLDKEKQREYHKKWYQKNKEKQREYHKLNKEKKREYDKKYYDLNREKIREYNKGYKELNGEKKREYDRKYCELNKEKRKEHLREHREKNKAICLEYLGGKCVKCGTTKRLEFDHIKREGKKYEIGSKLSSNFDILKEELDKCQLLCYDCHKIKTKSERTILTETCKASA